MYFDLEKTHASVPEIIFFLLFVVFVILQNFGFSRKVNNKFLEILLSY